MKRFGLVLAAGWCMIVVSGCKGKETPPTAPVTEAAKPILAASPPASLVALDPGTLGGVSGVVRFTGQAPAAVKIDTGMDPACGLPDTPSFTSEQYVVKDGKLANVYIYVKSGPVAAMAMGEANVPAVVLDQKGCRYTPHVIALMRGGSVAFRNSDVTMHNIHTMPTMVGEEAIDVSQGPKGAPVVKRFNTVEAMLPVRCNNHPWMNAFINVSATPFFAVTDADGRFSLKGLPAGQYVLGAVHEKLGEQTMSVTVAAKGTAKGDFTFAMK